MNKFLIILLVAITGGFAACSGDHSTRSGIDTVKSRYGSINDTSGASKKNVDTNKVTATTGDASDLDNSASGGAKVEKDTLHKIQKK